MRDENCRAFCTQTHSHTQNGIFRKTLGDQIQEMLT